VRWNDAGRGCVGYRRELNLRWVGQIAGNVGAEGLSRLIWQVVVHQCGSLIARPSWNNGNLSEGHIERDLYFFQGARAARIHSNCSCCM